MYQLSFYILAILIGFFSLYLIFLKKTLFINQFGLIFLFFYTIIPIFENTYNIKYTENNLSLYLSLTGLFYIFAFFFLTVLFYTFLSIKYPNLYIYNNINKSLHFSLQKKKIQLLRLSFLFLYLIILINNFEIYNFYREKDNNGLNIIKYEILEYFLKPLLFNIAFILIINNKKNPCHIILFILAVLTVFPTSIARFLTATLYGSLLVYIYLTKSSNFSIRIILFFNFLSIFILFPLINYFRRKEFNQIDLFTFYIDSFKTGHFDSFYNFCLAIELIPYKFNNILQAIFFWVPREIFLEKEFATNYYFGKYFNLKNDNVSIPLPAELLVSFDFFGLCIGACIFGLILFCLDKIWTYSINVSIINTLVLIQLSYLLIFLFRGPFLSSFAYVSGIMIGWLIIKLILLKFTK